MHGFERHATISRFRWTTQNLNPVAANVANPIPIITMPGSSRGVVRSGIARRSFVSTVEALAAVAVMDHRNHDLPQRRITGQRLGKWGFIWRDRLLDTYTGTTSQGLRSTAVATWGVALIGVMQAFG
jgi:hypothetical protein